MRIPGVNDPERVSEEARSGVAAVVLAGGRSRRMAQPKALLEISGQALLERVLLAAGSVAGEIVLVLGFPETSRTAERAALLELLDSLTNAGRFRQQRMEAPPARGPLPPAPAGFPESSGPPTPERSAASVLLPVVRVIEDEIVGGGPLAGLVRGLGSIHRPIALALPCDAPTLVPGLLRYLVRELENRPGVDAIVPIRGGRAEPMVAAYRPERTAAAFAAAFASGERALHRALARLAVHELGEKQWRRLDPEGASFVNLNDSDDVRSFTGLAT